MTARTRTLAPLGGVALGLMVSGLAGCGLRGDLERPAPLWGDAKVEYERQQAEEERLKAEQEAEEERERAARASQPQP